MTYSEYIRYHRQGDAGVEERTIARLCSLLALSGWDCFRLCYFYAMTYHIPSALDLLHGIDEERRLKFRTDRRWVRSVPGAFQKMLAELRPEKMEQLRACRCTDSAYRVVRKWFFFGRYAAYLFLEVYCNVFRPGWVDDLQPGWEINELYTKGAEIVAGSTDRGILNQFLSRAKKDTQDNVFAIETSLCAVAKFEKKTRWNGYYSQRMFEDAEGTRWKNLIFMAAG